MSTAYNAGRDPMCGPPQYTNGEAPPEPTTPPNPYGQEGTWHKTLQRTYDGHTGIKTIWRGDLWVWHPSDVQVHESPHPSAGVAVTEEVVTSNGWTDLSPVEPFPREFLPPRVDVPEPVDPVAAAHQRLMVRVTTLENEKQDLMDALKEANRQANNHARQARDAVDLIKALHRSTEQYLKIMARGES